MTAAAHVPVRRARREAHTADIKPAQRDSIVMPESGLPERGEIITTDKPLTNDYLQSLKMAEEPVTIMINKSPEKFAPLTVDCWVNGKGAEVMTDKGWLEFGWLPVGKPVTTKRKYVENLARSRMDSVQTHVGTTSDENPENRIDISTMQKAQFSVLHDANPLGGQWLIKLMSER